MSFQDDLMNDMADVFCNPDEFGEQITYTPRNGSAATYNALVIRNPPRRRAGDPIVKMEVHLARDATRTKGPASIDTGGDTITVAYRQGGTAEAFLVSEVSMQSPSSWMLRIF